jgi:hypothetical protein
MTDIYSHFDDNFRELIDKVTDDIELGSEDATVKMKNLKIFSECRPPQPVVPDLIPEAPTTRWGKVKVATAKVWDNETTRVLLKTGGAFAGVAVVAYSTIHKDHVMERQALAQANQRIS